MNVNTGICKEHNFASLVVITKGEPDKHITRCLNDGCGYIMPPTEAFERSIDISNVKVNDLSNQPTNEQIFKALHGFFNHYDNERYATMNKMKENFLVWYMDTPQSVNLVKWYEEEGWFYEIKEPA